MKRHIMRAVAALALAGGAAFINVPTAEAHTQPYDSTPGAEHNLCHLFDPYSNGYIYAHVRIDGEHRRCYVNYYDPYNCYRYDVIYAGPAGWVRVNSSWTWVTCP